MGCAACHLAHQQAALGTCDRAAGTRCKAEQSRQARKPASERASKASKGSERASPQRIERAGLADRCTSVGRSGTALESSGQAESPRQRRVRGSERRGEERSLICLAIMGGSNDFQFTPVEQMSTSETSDSKYRYVIVRAPRLAGIPLKCFVWMLENGITASVIKPKLKKDNLITRFFSNAKYEEPPMYVSQYPEELVRLDQNKDGFIQVLHSTPPAERVKAAVSCLPSVELERHDGFRHWTIRDYAEAYRNGTVTPTMVAERFLSALEESNKQDPPMSLFINYDEKDILRQAEESSARYLKGEQLSVLDGVPIAVKDEIDCLPYPTTGGTKWLHKVRETKDDAACIKRLRECGAVLVGKTNMHELGMGTTSINPHYGSPRNPYGKDRVSGGSSGGSAAAVASGLVPAALGVDGGGSVRMPAGLCGVVGLKATFGRTSNEGIIPLNWTVGMLGTLTATVEDALIMYAAVLGHLPQDRIVSIPPPAAFPISVGHPETEAGKLVGALKIAKYTEWFDDSDDDVKDGCYRALELLQQAYGNKIVEVTVPEIEEMRLAHFITIGSECYASLSSDYYNAGMEDSGADVRVGFAIYKAFNNMDFIAAQRMRFRQMHFFMDIFKRADVIVTPITGCTAPPLTNDSLKYGELNYITGAKLMRFQIAGNFLGLPAISVPVGHDHDGLPIGLQIIGRPWGEATLLQLAAAIENLCAPLRKRPEVLYDLLI
ncbi:amidase [Marchantia polymorpha subsp. ruderalis]